MIEKFCLQSTSGEAPLRIGLLLDGFVQPAWIASILDQIRQSNFARVELVVLNGEAQSPVDAGARAPLPVRVIRRLLDKNKRKRFLYGLYTTIEKSRISLPNDPFRPVDCEARLAGTERLIVDPVTKGFVQRFRPEDIELIRNRKLDVILRFGFNIIRGDILTSARYGVWSYHHGDNDWYRGGPSHFWEMAENHPISGVLLQVLSDELDGGLVLCKAWSATTPSLWVSNNRLDPYWVGSFFVIRKLHELHQYGWERLDKRRVANRFIESRKKIYRTPDNGEMLQFLTPRLWKRARAKLRARPVFRWRIALRQDPALFWKPGGDLTLEGFKWLEPPRGHFWADPFVFEKDGQTWIFFEDYLYSEGRGVISCAEYRDGQLGKVERVLDLPYHLSFPLVFEDNGKIYMIPETGANKTVELWGAVDFPSKWTKEAVLFEGAKALDTALWRQQDRYWFFVTFMDPPESGPQLYLFYSESLTGPWIYHRDNPISSDVRTARGGGAIFELDGKLIRPSQNCSPYYGYACNLNEITCLAPEAYEESLLTELLPSGSLTRIHTYSRGSSLELIDGQTASWHPAKT